MTLNCISYFSHLVEMPWKKEGIATTRDWFNIPSSTLSQLKCPEKKKGLRRWWSSLLPRPRASVLKCPEKKKGLRLNFYYLYQIYILSRWNALKKRRDCDLFPRIYIALSCWGWNALKKRRDCDKRNHAVTLQNKNGLLKCPEKKKGLRPYFYLYFPAILWRGWNALKKRRDCDIIAFQHMLKLLVKKCWNALKKRRDCDWCFTTTNP